MADSSHDPGQPAGTTNPATGAANPVQTATTFALPTGLQQQTCQVCLG